jgi:hypothetical protein
MWDSLRDFGETAVKAYRLDVWKHQDALVEVWLEKDALSGIFEEVLRPYGVTLNVGRGYDGWSSIHAAAERYLEWGGEVIVPYFGDFDPSGEDMLRSLQERLAYFETSPQIEKVAITKQDIIDYELPPDVTKAADTRRATFVAKWGDNAVELDALPVQVLRERIQKAVERHMDLEALAQVRKQEVDATVLFLVSLPGALRPQGDVPVRCACLSRTLPPAAQGPAREAEALRFFPFPGKGHLGWRVYGTE